MEAHKFVERLKNETGIAKLIKNTNTEKVIKAPSGEIAHNSFQAACVLEENSKRRSAVRCVIHLTDFFMVLEFDEKDRRKELEKERDRDRDKEKTVKEPFIDSCDEAPLGIISPGRTGAGPQKPSAIPPAGFKKYRYQRIEKVDECKCKFNSMGMTSRDGIGLSIHNADGTGITLALRSEKHRNECRVWMLELKKSDTADYKEQPAPREIRQVLHPVGLSLVPVDDNSVRTSDTLSSVSTPSSNLAAAAMATRFSNLDSQPLDSFIKQPAVIIRKESEDMGTRSSAMTIPVVRTLANNRNMLNEEKKGMTNTADSESEYRSDPASDDASQSLAMVDAEGVSTLTLILAVLVLFFSISVLIVVSNHRSYASELRARLSSAMSNQIDSGRDDFGAIDSAKDGPDSMESMYGLLGSVVRKKSEPSRVGVKDMKAEMKSRFQGKEQEREPQYDILFKMDFDRSERQTPRSPDGAAPADAGSAPGDSSVQAGNDVNTSGEREASPDNASSGQPLSPDQMKSILDNMYMVSALLDSRAQRIPNLPPEQLSRFMHQALYLLAEQYVKDSLGEELVGAILAKEWEIYDPHVLALLESKPGDTIRQHVLELLVSKDVDKGAAGLEKKPAT